MAAPLAGAEEVPKPVSITRYRLELVREDEVPYGETGDPSSAAGFLQRELAPFDREVMGALYLSCQNRVTGYTIAYIGTMNRAAVEPRGVIVPGLLCCASSLILFHNHPSGNPSPSQQDLRITRRIADACELVGINFVDHLIFGEPPSYVSLRRRGAW